MYERSLYCLSLCYFSEHIVFFQTKGRGFGLRTKVDIEPGTLIQEYRGEIISEYTCMERMRTIYADYENYFFLNYDGDEVLDGCIKGTEVRFVNHSCDPNCHIEKW